MPDRRSLAASLRMQAAAAALTLAVPFASADASTAPLMEPDENAWHIVNFVRSLSGAAPK